MFLAKKVELRTNEILIKLTEGILGAKTFTDTPKWEVEGGPLPRTFFSDRLKRNSDRPINKDAVFWLIKLYNAQLGIYKMKEPIEDEISVKISNDLELYIASITCQDLSKLKNNYNDSDSMKKRKCLIEILGAVLNSSIDKEYFDPSLVSSEINNIINSLVLGEDYPHKLKMALVSEVSGKCPFCNHELIERTGNDTVETFKIIEFPIDKHIEQHDYIAVCNNCYEKYNNVSDNEVLSCLCYKKNTILSKKNFERSVDALEMEREIGKVLYALTDADFESLPKFQYDPVEVRKKITDDSILCNKILVNVVQYFPFVEEKLKQLNNERRLTYEKISGDVKRAYLEFATNETSKEVIFNQLCDWLAKKAQTDNKSACEVIISYYVQNCEVFERDIAE